MYNYVYLLRVAGSELNQKINKAGPKDCFVRVFQLGVILSVFFWGYTVQGYFVLEPIETIVLHSRIKNQPQMVRKV